MRNIVIVLAVTVVITIVGFLIGSVMVGQPQPAIVISKPSSGDPMRDLAASQRDRNLAMDTMKARQNGAMMGGGIGLVAGLIGGIGLVSVLGKKKK